MYFDKNGDMEMSGEEFANWVRTHPGVFVVFEDDEEIPYEAHDMDKTVHFRHQCPHHNMHGTLDVEMELHGHHVVMKGYHNGEKIPGDDGGWPIVQRLGSDDDALRFYLRARRGFVGHNFEIVDA